jgi:SAM-dependent methyltransferase
MQQLYQIRFPATDGSPVGQDQAYFFLRDRGEEYRIRFHDYDRIFAYPGLYEQLFYLRLRCASPKKARDILEKVLHENQLLPSELRVLDLGAGNGMVGELLDAARVVGVDISEQARQACERDRPGTYDAYYVADMTNVPEPIRQELEAWQFDCMSCVAALGFGDVPVSAFVRSYNLIQNGGWIVFNIKETFLQESDTSGFSRLIKHLLLRDTLEVHHMERYRHRVSINGAPLFTTCCAAASASPFPSSCSSCTTTESGSNHEQAISLRAALAD